MNLLVAAVYGVVAGFVAYVVLYLLATIVVALAPLVYPAAVLIGLVVFVSGLTGHNPFVRP